MDFKMKVHQVVESISNKVIEVEFSTRWLLVANAAVYGIVKFIEFASNEVGDGDRLLDAGAGPSPYRKYFRHAKYESADRDGKHDFICDIERLPVADNSYDVIINTQVIEHVKDPQAVLAEFYRVLKPRGKLFLTAPQGFGVHSTYNYFNFLEAGLRLLFENAEFTVISIKPFGGMFWMMGYHIRILPWYVYRQYLNEKYMPSLNGFLLLPFFVVVFPICRYLIPWALFYLDRLDKKQCWTLNYGCYARKS
jgi:SAM-dependent methyltransferase